ncbi:nitrite reductase small subunit NirD [Streptomyces sp. NPDC004111]|uniref:nitrite reductase small subunit NirD n=1 Tax=Streptomyces sp. NPDC004111 TaxID=3364690 RepID=UPI00369CA630
MSTAATPVAAATAAATAVSTAAVPPVVMVEVETEAGWTAVCPYDSLTPGRGVAALVDGAQIALYRDRTGRVHAVGNRDPFSGAHVLSRGLLGSRDGVPVVLSPMYKQAFDLRTGNCLDEESAPDGSPATLPTWATRLTPSPDPSSTRWATP